MSLFYFSKVDKALGSLGITPVVADLDTVKKLKTFGEKEDFWPKETAIFIYYFLPDEMKPKSSESIIKLWVNKGEAREHILISIKQMITQNGPALSDSTCNILEDLVSVYSINVFELSEKRMESVVVSLAYFITQEAVKNSGRNMANLNDNERYLAMLICLVASGYLANITNQSFEILSAVACMNFDKHKGADLGELISNYNRMTKSPSESRVLEAIGNQVMQFVATGQRQYLDNLGELYGLLISKIKN